MGMRLKFFGQIGFGLETFIFESHVAGAQPVAVSSDTDSCALEKHVHSDCGLQKPATVTTVSYL